MTLRTYPKIKDTFDSLQYVVETQNSVSLSIYSIYGLTSKLFRA